MSDRGDRIEKKRDWYAIAMLLCGVFFLALHLTFVGFTNDDAYFVSMRSNWDKLIPLLIDRYQTESTRVLSEALLFTFVRCPFLVWQLADTLICLLVCHASCVILVGDREDVKNLWVLLFFAIYPYMHQGSAGWICTSLNYIWVTAALLYALSGSIRRLRGERPRAWQYVLYIASMIFAANSQQTAVALVMAYALIGVRRWLDAPRGKRLRAVGYEAAGVVIGLAGIVFALAAPGTEVRTAMEVANWMPEFYDLSFWDKLRLCAVFVFEHFVQIPDVSFFLFSILLLYTGREHLRHRVIAWIPLAIDVVYTACWFVPVFLIEHRTHYDFTTPSIYLTDARTALLQIAELFGLCLYIAATVVILWCSVRELWKRLGMIWALAIGFATRMLLMLSPTMFASWHRTLLLFYFAILGDSVLLLDAAEEKRKKRSIIAITAVGIAVNLILTVGLQIRKRG